MSKLGKIVAACAAVVVGFGTEAETIKLASGGDIAAAVASAK